MSVSRVLDVGKKCAPYLGFEKVVNFFHCYFNDVSSSQVASKRNKSTCKVEISIIKKTDSAARNAYVSWKDNDKP